MQIETKTYVNGREVILVADAYSTKIYQDAKNIGHFYVTSCDDVVASIFKDSIDIDDKYLKRELLK